MMMMMMKCGGRVYVVVREGAGVGITAVLLYNKYERCPSVYA